MKNTTKTLAIVSTTIVVLFIVLLIIGSVANKKEARFEYPEYTSQNTEDVFREGFMEGCVVEPGLESYCTCAFDTLLVNMGLDQFAQESIDYAISGTYSQEMDYQLDVAVNTCL